MNTMMSYNCHELSRQNSPRFVPFPAAPRKSRHDFVVVGGPELHGQSGVRRLSGDSVRFSALRFFFFFLRALVGFGVGKVGTNGKRSEPLLQRCG